jgi:hypothetical protein
MYTYALYSMNGSPEPDAPTTRIKTDAVTAFYRRGKCAFLSTFQNINIEQCLGKNVISSARYITKPFLGFIPFLLLMYQG